MRYSNAVVTKEDFERELRIRDNRLLDRFAQQLNGRANASRAGYDTDNDDNPAKGQDE